VDAAFLESLLNRPHRVYGLKLAPFSFWHVLGLHVIESPFIGGPGSPSPEALFDAARICSARFPAFHRRPASLLAQWWFYRPLRAHRASHVAELSRFDAYLRDHHAPPEFLTRQDDKPLKVPWPLARVAALMRFAGLSEADAWNMPVGRGLWLCAALAEAGGADVDLVTPSLRKAMAEAGRAI
jgi:hypothetical protein